MGRSLLALAIVALVVTGCSDKGDEYDPQEGRAPTEPVVSELPVTEGAAGPGVEHRAFCEGYGVLDRLFDELPDGSLEEMRASVTTLADESASLAAGAPDEVIEDVRVMAAYFAAWRDAASTATSRDEAVGAPAKLASTEEFQDAGQRLHGWVEEHCPA